MSELMITVLLLPQPGSGEHLARHLKESLELAVVNELAERLSDQERAGVAVTSQIWELPREVPAA
jgi:hypothetical protein